MIRPLTLVSLLVAAGAGLYLYQVKHSVSMLDRELRDINRQTEMARERSQVLRAEWALLNEPDRLRQVTQRHLPLEPMAPTQFIRSSEMERRLPAVRPFAGPPSLFGPPDTAVAAPEALMAPPPAPTAPAAGVVPARPVAVAPPAAVASPAPAPAPRPVAAEPAPRFAAVVAPPPPPAPRPAPAPSLVKPALHVAPPAPAPPAIVTSALGGTGSALAPPVPLPRPVPVGAPQGGAR